MADHVFVAPASYGQERLWLASQADPETSRYPTFAMLDLPVALDPDTLAGHLSIVATRHEVLRTSLEVRDDRLVQLVHPEPTVPLAVTDLSHLDGNASRLAATELLRADLARPFALDVAPLWRARLVRHANRWQLLLVAHHSVFDGNSVTILGTELRELSAAALAGRAAKLPELPIQYADYAAWQRDRLAKPELAEQLDYWRAQLAGAPSVHGLPLDRPRSGGLARPGSDFRFTLPAGTSAAAARLARRLGAGRSMVMLAGYVATVARVSGQSEVVVGVPVAGRTDAQLGALIGMFVNTLVIRVGGLDRDPPFARLVELVRDRMLDALDHQDIPFQILAEHLARDRHPGVHPLYQLGFNDLDTTGLGPRTGESHDELMLELSEDDCRLEYRTDLFERGTIERFASWFGRVVAAALADPDRRLSALPLLDPAERHQLLVGFNPTGGPEPAGDATLVELIRRQVARTPGAVAAQFEGTTLRYAELDAWAGRIAAYLRTQGIGPECLVGVHAERSLGLVAGLLGVLRAGAAYVPLDPEYPQQRRDFMTADAGLTVVLTGDRIAQLRDAPSLAEPEPAAGHPDHLAYVIYTSGSTGQPKGVANTHRGLVNRLAWMQRAFPLGPDDVVVQKTPFSFDVSVWEFFWPLLAGARLVLARPGGHRDPRYLQQLFASTGVTTAHFVPSMLAAFLAAGAPQACPALRRVVCSGEELPAGLARDFLAAAPHCQLYNLYGPTEAAIDVSWWRCDGGDVVPIGRPIQNLRLYVLDRYGEPAPVGVPGELSIGGVGLARGYWRRPGLTARRFVPDPFGPPGSRLYRTGDAAVWGPDGALRFLGRLDDQVKLRGMRVELGEIASALRDQPGVVDAAVVVREDRPGERQLVAYVVGAAGPADPAVLRSALAARLPEYMLPASFVELPELPVTPNGKLDRAALPAPAERHEPAGTPMEEALLAAWRTVLDRQRLGVTDDFFAAGGDSIRAISVVGEARKRGVEVTSRELLELRTVRAVAARARAVPVPEEPPEAAAEPDPGTAGYLPADFPDAGLDEAGLASVLDRLGVGREPE